MNKTRKAHALHTTLAIGAALGALAVPPASRAGGTYTWLASPQNANWDTSSANWNDGANAGVPWADNAADPNSAVFPASSATELTVGSTRHVNDLTIDSTGYKFSGTGPLTVAGTIAVNGGSTYFKGALASGRGDGSLRFSSKAGKIIYVNGSNGQTGTYVDGNPTFAPNSDAAFGVVPGSEMENIFIVGTPTIYGGGAFSIHSNRTIKISSGKYFATRTDSSPQFTYKNRIVAENSPGCDYSTNTYVSVPGSTSYPIAFDPGNSRTNAFGRLQCYGQLKVVSGVTMLTGRGGTDTNAYLKVEGNSSTTFSDTKGALVVQGGELYVPASFTSYVDVRKCGHVTVTNGGKIYMPGVHWLNGISGPGRLTVAKGGEVVVGTLRLSQSPDSASQVHLNEGGILRAKSLYVEGTGYYRCDFHFNGGTFQSLQTALFNGGSQAWSDRVRFLIDKGGAIFDTNNGVDVWWYRPLTSGVAANESDGGVRKTAGTGTLIFLKPNSYNGPTQVDGGTLHARADNALPPGTTLKLANDALVNCYTYDLESPSRMTTNWLSRVEGNGLIGFSAQLHVTNAIAPSVGGELAFSHPCDLRGDLVIAASAGGCGHVKFVAAGQSLAGLSLRLASGSVLATDKARDFYKVVDAPNGYGNTQFAAVELPKAWEVRYAADGVYLRHIDATVLSVR